MNEKLEKNENKKTADVLRAENLVRDYVQYGEDGEKKKEIHVLKGLNFSIQRQEFVGIMGRSGCGKTTLLKLLGMIDRQTGGKLFFEEHDTEDLWKDEFADIRRRKIGFVFQDFYLMDSLSGKISCFRRSWIRRVRKSVWKNRRNMQNSSELHI